MAEPRQVIRPHLPMRSAPDGAAAYVNEALYGETVECLCERDGWAEIRLSDGYHGHVDAMALAHPAAPPTHRVSAIRTHLYPDANLKTPPVCDLSFASLLCCSGEQRNGFHATSQGWIYGRHIVPAEQREPDYLAVAMRFRGTPYLWGGRSAFGLDCSALIQLALHTAGIDCPRDSGPQQDALPRVEGPPQRGDIVFFPGHVGLMVDNAHLLHANATHMAVSVDPLGTVASWTRKESGKGVTAIARV